MKPTMVGTSIEVAGSPSERPLTETTASKHGGGKLGREG